MYLQLAVKMAVRSNKVQLNEIVESIISEAIETESNDSETDSDTEE